MNEREALKLAQEALEELLAEKSYWWQEVERDIVKALEKAESICKQVMAEQPEQQQDPVAWLELLREARDNCKASIVEEGISTSRKEYRIDLEARLTAALNTSPPAQRTWVGLTNKERETATGWSVEHIEDFLKQKNGYAEEKNT